MKVLLINTVPTEKNGITNVMLNYLRAMDISGITFDFLSINEPEKIYRDVVEEKGGKMYVLPRLNGTKAYWVGLKKLIKSNKYDAVHIHGNSHTLVIELSAAWAAGCKVRIVHSHNTTCKYVKVHKLMTVPFNLLYSHGLACGNAAGKWMFGEQQFSVVNNGIDTDKFAFNSAIREQIRREIKWENCKVIGQVGSMIEAKNHRFIIDVFKEIYQQDNSYRLLLIGDGPLRPELETNIKNYNLKDVISMTGNINNVDEYLNAMDLILMPSLFEGLPLTLIEQQANGLQCVVADTITTEADKSGNMFFLSLNSSPSVWAEKILTIDCLRGRSDRSIKAVKDIKDCGYSIQEEAKKLKTYYEHCITK